MAVKGRKQLSYTERQKLFRSTPKEIRFYDNELVNTYLPLIESFKKEDYRLYERLIHAYKRVASMLAYCENRKVTGPVLELAIIRSKDLKLHQRLVQVLRHRWTNISDKWREEINQNSDKFWFNMAGQIQRRSKDENITLYPEWQGTEGRTLLIEFLKTQYEKQNRKCAISKEELSLTVGAKGKNPNKCSPDRKNSNLGYTPDNLWFVTWWANAMKMDMPMITFWKRVDVLSEARKINSEIYQHKARY
jgi:hypothetical protein